MKNAWLLIFLWSSFFLFNTNSARLGSKDGKVVTKVTSKVEKKIPPNVQAKLHENETLGSIMLKEQGTGAQKNDSSDILKSEHSIKMKISPSGGNKKPARQKEEEEDTEKGSSDEKSIKKKKKLSSHKKVKLSNRKKVVTEKVVHQRPKNAKQNERAHKQPHRQPHRQPHKQREGTIIDDWNLRHKRDTLEILNDMQQSTSTPGQVLTLPVLDAELGPFECNEPQKLNMKPQIYMEGVEPNPIFIGEGFYKADIPRGKLTKIAVDRPGAYNLVYEFPVNITLDSLYVQKPRYSENVKNHDIGKVKDLAVGISWRNSRTKEWTHPRHFTVRLSKTKEPMAVITMPKPVTDTIRIYPRSGQHNSAPTLHAARIKVPTWNWVNFEFIGCVPYKPGFSQKWPSANPSLK